MCNNRIKNLKAIKSITIISVLIQKVNRNQIKTNKMIVNIQIVNNIQIANNVQKLNYKLKVNNIQKVNSIQIVNNIQIVNQNNILNLKIRNIFNKNPKFQILIFLNLFKIYKKIQ